MRHDRCNTMSENDGTSGARWARNDRSDDDNDGVVDELDCAPFDATVTTCPDRPAPGGGNTGGSGGSGGSDGSGGAAVTVACW